MAKGTGEAQSVVLSLRAAEGHSPESKVFPGDDWLLLLNRLEPELTNPPGHLWRDKWTTLSGPLLREPLNPTSRPAALIRQG